MNNDGWGFQGAGTSDFRIAGNDLQHNRQKRTADEAPHQHRIIRQQAEGGGPMKEYMQAHESHHAHTHPASHPHYMAHESHHGHQDLHHHLDMEKQRHEDAKDHAHHHLERHHSRHHDSQHGHDHHKHNYHHHHAM